MAAPLLLLLALAGCGKDGQGHATAGAAAALASPPGAYLAYEHRVQLHTPAAQIGPRLQAVSEACQRGTYGDCAVLQVAQQGGDMPLASIEVRIAPAGVEPLIALASEKGEISTRSTSAEDLAQQVADTRLVQARLTLEHERLLQYQQRKDLAVADLLTLSTRLSEIEAGLQQAEREAAQQHRRIDTQRLTLSFAATSSQRSRSEIGRALSESGSIFTTSLAYLIRVIAGLLPVLVLAGGLGWVVRIWWRRRRPAGKPD